MLVHSSALWRIEYRTDLTKSNAPILPVGFALEARWSDDVRWLGMLFRKRLMPLELDGVNLETWPELQSLEPFMTGLFEKTWEIDIGAAASLALGSSEIARGFGSHSSLQFVSDAPGVTLSSTDPEESFSDLYNRLLGLHSKLAPAVSAPVVPLQPRPAAPAKRPARADVEQVLRAA